MKSTEEKKAFDLLDRLQREDALTLSELYTEDASHLADGDQLDSARSARLKARTFAKLNAKETALPTPPALQTIGHNRRSRNKRRTAITVSAACMLIAAAGLLGTTEGVRADLKKVLRFVPGLGVAIEEDIPQQTYVLPKPYVQKVGGMELTVDAIAIQQRSATVALRGTSSPPVKEFELLAGGRSYPFRYYAVSSSGIWSGSYGYKGTILLPDHREVSLKLGDTVIGPIALVKPRTADDVTQLGESDIKQGIRITAMATPIDGDQVRVQLIPSFPWEGWRVEDYGVDRMSKADPLGIEDSAGVPAEVSKEDMSYPSDLRFKRTANTERPPSKATGAYKLTIPSVLAVNSSAKPVDVALPIPAVIGASIDVEVQTQIDGLPLTFTRITRSSDTGATLDVDVHYDASQLQTLQYFIVGRDDPNLLGFSWRVDETTHAMQQLNLAFKQGEKTLQFQLKEPHVVLKGPWRIPLTINPLSP